MNTTTFTIDRSKFPRIVTDGEDSPPLRFAAEELRRYLGRILGTPGAPDRAAPAPCIRLSVTSDAGFAEDEFEIAADREGLAIRGAAGRAVLSGAYELLRRFGGCCFSGPAPHGEHVPSRKVLEIGPLPLRLKPKFWHRALQLYSKADLDLVRARIDWMGKNGFNFVAYNVYDDTIPFVHADGTLDPATREQREQEESRFSETVFNTHLLPELQKRGIQLHAFAHNLLNFLPPGKYFSAHPEWYMLKDGKRIPHGGQLCLCTSNPDMVGEYIRNVLACFESKPELAAIAIGPQDGFGWCECDACRAMDDHPDDVFKPEKHFRSPEGENQSKIRRYARFVNAVAEAVCRECPDRFVTYSGYVDLDFSPRGMKLEDNTMAMVSTYWRCAAHSFGEGACPANAFFGDTIRRWRQAHSGRLIVGDNAYEGMGSQRRMPYPVDEVICEDWDLFYQLGIDGNYAQTNDVCFTSYALNYFAFGRCCWQDKVDPSAMLDEFLMGMFGNAGKALRPIYDSFHRTIRKIRPAGKSYSVFLHEHPKWKKIYPEKLDACLEPTGANVACFLDDLGEEKLEACLIEARRLAADEREREQVRAFSDVTGFWRKAAAFYRLYWPTDLYPDQDAARVREALRQSKKACAAVIEYLARILPQRKGWISDREALWWERTAREIDDRIKKLETP